MKQFLIKYVRRNATAEEWHRDIGQFIANLDNDPALAGKISYRCLKVLDRDEYYHFAKPADDQAVKALQERDFFKRYTEKTKLVSGGSVEVLPLEIVAETAS